MLLWLIMFSIYRIDEPAVNTYVHRVTAEGHVAAAAAQWSPATVRGSSPQRAGVVLRLSSSVPHQGGVSAQEVLLGGS